MALPVNKKILDSTIATNLPINNGQQLITAEKLQQTLTPIVNSTFGLKTIWYGYMYVTSDFYWITPPGSFPVNYAPKDAVLNDRMRIFIQERYYDPNYFPALDPNSLDTNSFAITAYEASGCRYKMTNRGSLLNDGSFNNVTTTIISPTDDPGWTGTGLTFDCLIQGGQLRAFKVNNPGTGYCWGKGSTGGTVGFKPTVVQFELNGTGDWVKPQVTIDLSRVIDLDNGLIGYGTTSSYARNKALNLFIPNAGPDIGYGNVITVSSEGFRVEGSGNVSNEEGLASSSTINFDPVAAPDVTGQFKTPPYTCAYDAGFNTFNPTSTTSTIIKGYHKKDWYPILVKSNSTTPGSSLYGKQWLIEVKVPITNTTI